MPRLYNLTRLKARRRQLRRQSIPSEIRLWNVLRNRQFLGLKWRRQHSIGNSIVDFYCPQLSLAIEIDGDSHFVFDQSAHDKRRQYWLEQQGIMVVRWLSLDVMQNLDGVLQQLRALVLQRRQGLSTVLS